MDSMDWSLDDSGVEAPQTREGLETAIEHQDKCYDEMVHRMLGHVGEGRG